MIVEYHRPSTIESTIKLLSRREPTTVPLGGGTTLNRPSLESFAVVDLQFLHLNKIKKIGNTLEIGAMVTLQNLLENPNSTPVLVESIRHQATYNTRQIATVAGSLVAADGRSPFATMMLALDPILIIEPGGEKVNLGDLFPFRTEKLPGKLITKVIIPLNVLLGYEYVARTPADLPLVSVGISSWDSGRTRVVLGGFGKVPILAFDGMDSVGTEIAASDAFKNAGDQWASAEYRSEVAQVLTSRCLKDLRGT